MNFWSTPEVSETLPPMMTSVPFAGPYSGRRRPDGPAGAAAGATAGAPAATLRARIRPVGPDRRSIDDPEEHDGPRP